MYFRFFPNILSISRIFIAPFFVIIMLKNTFLFKIVGLILFFVGSLTDILDGYIARKYNIKSEFGKYIDPLADKILVIITLCILSFFYPNQITMWMIIVLLARDIFVMCYRKLLINNNYSLETSKYAKLKTLFQIVVIHILLILHIINPDYILLYNFTYYLILLCVMFSFFTALHYIGVNSLLIKK